MFCQSQKAKEVTGGVFGALAKCVKNLDAKKDPSLVAAVVAELTKVDGELRTLLYVVRTDGPVFFSQIGVLALGSLDAGGD